MSLLLALPCIIPSSTVRPESATNCTYGHTTALQDSQAHRVKSKCGVAWMDLHGLAHLWIGMKWLMIKSMCLLELDELSQYALPLHLYKFAYGDIAVWYPPNLLIFTHSLSRLTLTITSPKTFLLHPPFLPPLHFLPTQAAYQSCSQCFPFFLLSIQNYTFLENGKILIKASKAGQLGCRRAGCWGGEAGKRGYKEGRGNYLLVWVI